MAKALRREGLPTKKLTASPLLGEMAQAMGFADLDALYVSVGAHHASARSVAQRVARELRSGEGEEQLPVTARTPRRRRPNSGVHVEGLDDVMVRLSRCCTPVPGDELIGFVTRGRGVTVHRSDCANAVSLAQGQHDRIIEVDWDQHWGNSTFVVSIEVKALDRSKLLRDVSATLADHHVNILACASQTGSDRISRMRFDFELADPTHLDSLIATIRRIESVYDAYRVLPGRGG